MIEFDMDLSPEDASNSMLLVEKSIAGAHEQDTGHQLPQGSSDDTECGTLSTLPFQLQAEGWGQAYEILVKRGVLACLFEYGILNREHPALEAWRKVRLQEVSQKLIRYLDVIDENAKNIIRSALDHMALAAFGSGYTAMRAYLKQIGRPLHTGKLKLHGLWCPLTMPGESTASKEARNTNLRAFHGQFGLAEPLNPELSAKGMPANADFMLWFSSEQKTTEYLLVQEYSFDMPGDIGDFRDQAAHLNELTRYRRIVESRSVFASVTAEVETESFNLADDLKQHLTALTSENKPLYKLCQACSYASSTVKELHSTGISKNPVVARALAITPNGLESLAARFEPSSTTDNPLWTDRPFEQKEGRRRLMEQMGEAYRAAPKLRDGDTDGLTRKVASAFKSMLNKLPKGLRAELKSLQNMPKPGQDFLFEFSEEVKSFANPMQKFSVGEATALIEDTDETSEFFSGSAKEAITRKMEELSDSEGRLTLRNMHAATIVAGMEQARPGRLNVIALEGNPGIGKTTAVRRYLSAKSDGYLFHYVSPRVVINRDVTESMSYEKGELTGILTITSNAPLNTAAKRYHDELVQLGEAQPRFIDGAVVVDGVANLVTPEQGSILVLTPAEETLIDTRIAGDSYRKDTLSESEDMVVDSRRMGVLSGISRMSRELLALNPEVNRIVMTAALQGFRERNHQSTTIDALSNIFENKADSYAGVAERRQFASRMPNIVVMVDELTGDGAGAPFIHAIARWLSREFVECFEELGEDSPFTVSLIVSDASLGNEVVLERYLNAANTDGRSPDKVLVSRSRGEQPFAIAVTPVRIGGALRQALHVMTNSFPASALHIRYQSKLTRVRIEESKPGTQETPRQAIRRVSDDALRQTAFGEIIKALRAGAGQVIYFAQDKNFLSDLRVLLIQAEEVGLNFENVAILDSSIPGPERAKLVKPERRDSIRVFLMTSSGARGVSFPRTDWIIANMPRFNIEGSLMEIAQLIYRGRGSYVNEHGETISGDEVPRHLVMLTEDFIVSDKEFDERQWLRQAFDLLTLLVMLRSTIYTRITGAAGLRQNLALVPVGGVGVEEMVSLMSQNVAKFLSEAEVFLRRNTDKTLIGLIKNARENVTNLFSRTRLIAQNPANTDNRSLVKREDFAELRKRAASRIAPLLVEQPGKSIPDHMFFAGPVVFEDWSLFSKQEVFTFEGHTTQIAQCSAELLKQLYRIDQDVRFQSALRQPAKNLFRLITRDKEGAANEFSTLKKLQSQNTWLVVPTGYFQFVYNDETSEGQQFITADPDLWHSALTKTLGASSAVMPPVPHYDLFPWAAAVGYSSPLNLDLVFDDRYFMASNELNMLNTLLLADSVED